MHTLRFLLASIPFVPLLACSSSGAVGPLGSGGHAGAGGHGTSSASTAAGTGGGDAGVDAGPIGGDRPVEMHVPTSYQPGTPVPLVLMLHGYSASADLQEDYLQITPQSDKRGFI